MDSPAIANSEHIVAGCNEFALDLYRLLANGTDENIIFSPSSLVFALAMTMAGARGETERQMAETMHLPISPDVHEVFRQLLETTRSSGVEFHIANRLFGQQGYDFRPEFLELTERYYGAGLQSIDFGNSHLACQIINSWVGAQTNQKIQEIVQATHITPDTVLALANAVHFLGKWHSPFDADLTQEAKFHLADGKTSPVPMMRQTSDFLRMSESDEFCSLELPYRNEHIDLAPVESNFAMQVFLPEHTAGLDQLERSISTSDTIQLANAAVRTVDVRLPKFRAESFYEMQHSLPQVGMRLPFGPEADFSSMSRDQAGLFITDVLHKALVDVDEQGTEAAATTVVLMGRGAPSKPTIFNADHPFLFLIRDRGTGLIHFIGRFVGPESA